MKYTNRVDVGAFKIYCMWGKLIIKQIDYSKEVSKI